MRPEDIDKLFRERLGDVSRTPSSDAWQRLQDQLQPPPKKKVIPMWWSIAASVAFLLLLGSFLYLNQREGQGPAEMASTGKPAEQVTLPGAGLAQDPAQDQREAPERIAEAGPQKEAPGETATDLGTLPDPSERLARVGSRAGSKPAAAPASPTTHSAKGPGHGKEIRLDEKIRGTENPGLLALDKPAARPAQVSTPAAETIEVIILKQEPAPVLASADDLDEEAAEGNPSRRGKIVRGILKQVKNIAAGEKVNLAEVGLDNYSIALETQIGNRKISKTINF